jgi:hypothetical protein
VAHWNRYDDAVAHERHMLRDWGLTHRPRAADSYRAQALRELAHRLELEQALAEVRAALAQAIDRYEAAECEVDILRLPGGADGL